MLERVLQKLGYYSEREANRRFKPEAAAYQFYCQYLGPEDIVVEAGAFRGYTTVGMLVKFAKFVYAFEPNPDDFKHLKGNARGFELRLRIFNLGLSDREEVSEMWGKDGYASFLNKRPYPSAKARVVPLDSLHLDPSPTVLILDCEGMEPQAIKGAEKTIAKSVHSVLVETHEIGSADTEPEVKDMLSQLGFADIQTRMEGWNTKDGYHGRWVLARRAKLPS
jgi:FkbM family methyltransferase